MTYEFQSSLKTPNLRGVPIVDEVPSDARVGYSRIGKSWAEGATRKFLRINSPATGELVGYVSMAARSDVDAAVRAADGARSELLAMGHFARAALCRRVAEIVEERTDEIARLLSLEQGKPFHAEAKGELAATAAGFRNAGEQIKWLTTDAFPLEDPNKRAFSFLQPKGIMAAITPWNFPLALPALYYLGPALATGNTVVWIAAPTTSLVATELMKCIIDAGVPDGAINLILGEGAVVGDAAVTHPAIHSIGFTGSTATGKTIAARAPGKHLMLELGGNGPTIVLDDADVEMAAREIGLGCFANAGQICTATERILVHKSVHDRFIEGLVEVAKTRRSGDPFDTLNNLGPLNNAPTLDKMNQHMADARKSGAEIVHGGNPATDMATNLFFEPTVVTGLNATNLLNVEESFGPVAPVLSFGTMQEALDLAASSPYGLSAALFTASTRNAFQYAEALRVGIVNVNEKSCYWEPTIPAGGAAGSDSGLGRTGGLHTLREMCDLKTITFDVRR